MPPIVGIHEGIAVLPGVGHRLHERHAFNHAAARLQAMRDHVVRPGIAALHLDRLAGMGVGLVEAIALLQAESVHGPDIMVVAVGRQDALADPQDAFGIAAIDGVDLADLGRHQVARPFGDDVLMDLLGTLAVAREPGLGGGEPGLLARIGASGELLGPVELALGQLEGLSGIHRQQEIGRHQRQQGTALFFVGCGHDLGQALAKGQPLVAQQIDRFDRFGASIADIQALTVPCHLIPSLR